MTRMITTTDRKNRLLPGISAIINQEQDLRKEWQSLYKTLPSKRAFEQILMTSGLGPAQEVPELSQIQLGFMEDRYKITVNHRAIGTGFAISRQAQDDDLYEDKAMSTAEELKQAYISAQNTYAFEIFNRAWDTTFPWADGKPIISSQHDTVTGTFSNDLTDDNNVFIDFSQAGVEGAVTKIDGFPAQNGGFRNLTAKHVVVDYSKRFDADRIFGSKLGTGNGNNDINPLAHKKYISEGVVITKHLFNSNSWFVTSDAPQGLLHYEREKPETTGDANDSTKSLIFRIWGRFSFMVGDPQCMVGSKGA